MRVEQGDGHPNLAVAEQASPRSAELRSKVRALWKRAVSAKEFASSIRSKNGSSIIHSDRRPPLEFRLVAIVASQLQSCAERTAWYRERIAIKRSLSRGGFRKPPVRKRVNSGHLAERRAMTAKGANLSAYRISRASTDGIDHLSARLGWFWNL